MITVGGGEGVSAVPNLNGMYRTGIQWEWGKSPFLLAI